MSVKSWVKFIILGFIWGSSFLWIKIGVDQMGPFTLVTFRVLFALLGYAIWMVFKRPKWPGWRVTWKFIILGVFNVSLPFVLITWGEQYISSGLTSILNSGLPLFTVVLAWLFLPDEKPTLRKGLGVLVGFGGVVVLMSDGFGNGLRADLLGTLAVLVASFSYAATAIFSRRQLREIPAEAQAIGQTVVATAIMMPLTAVVEAPFSLPALPITWLAVAWLGLLGSCIASVMYYSLLQSDGPTHTSQITYMIALVGVVLGIIFLKESVDWRLLVGGVLVIGGIIMVNQAPGAVDVRV